MKMFTLILSLLLLGSCQKKKQEEPVVQQTDRYVPPTSPAEIDTMQMYRSPTDLFRDRSSFRPENFLPQQVEYRGARNISYQLAQPGNAVTVVVEYLNGMTVNGSEDSTATRLLVFAKNELLYRKAIPVDFAGPVNFASVQKVDFSLIRVSSTKSLLYYWFSIQVGTTDEQQHYHAVSIDTEGISNELTGDIARIGGNFATIRFQDEHRFKARIPPNHRYPDITIDLIFEIDWSACTAALDVPADTVFTVSEQPKRYFNSKIKLYASPDSRSTARQAVFRRLTQAQMQRMFAPSLFDSAAVARDFLYLEFNRTTKGWIDSETMLFEELLAER